MADRLTATPAAEMAWSITETWKRSGFHGIATGVACYQAPSRVVIMTGDMTYTVDVSTEGVEPVETVHWFPDDLVEWQHDGAYGQKVTSWGVIGTIERLPVRATLWVYVPGHVEPKPWPAAECRLLRRVNKNKEGQ